MDEHRRSLFIQSFFFSLSKGQHRSISGLLLQGNTLTCSDAYVINAIMFKCTKPHTQPIIYISLIFQDQSSKIAIKGKFNGEKSP